METVEVTWENKSIVFQGRNGVGKCSGVQISESYNDNAIRIEPITSKGLIGNCWIEIDKGHITEIVRHLIPLDKILEAAGDRLPTLLGLDPCLDPCLDSLIENQLKKEKT